MVTYYHISFNVNSFDWSQMVIYICDSITVYRTFSGDRKSEVHNQKEPFKPWIECPAQSRKIAIWLKLFCKLNIVNVKVMKYWHRFNNIIFKYESGLLSRIHHVGRQTIDHGTQIRRQNIDQHITQTKASKDQRLTKETSAIFFTLHCKNYKFIH